MRKLLLVLITILAVSTAMESRTAVAGDHSWVGGLAGGCAYISQGWHFEIPYYQALDLTRSQPSCPGYTAGLHTYYRAYGFVNDLRVRFENYAITTQCTGVRVDVYDWDTDAFVGSINYVHINPGSGVIGHAPIYEGLGWTIAWLGPIASSQPNCSWFGAHLHQSARYGGANGWYHNGAKGFGQTLSPQAEPYNNWLHTKDAW